MTFEETLLRLQDAYGESAHVYSRILDREGNPMTESSERLYEVQDDYIRSLVTDSCFTDAREAFGDERAQNILDLDAPEGILFAAVAMRGIDGRLQGIWFVCTNDESVLQSEDNPLTWRLSKEAFNVRLALLENICHMLLTERAQKESLTEKLGEIEHTRDALAKQLHRNEVMTEIIKQMEKDDDFEEIVKAMLPLCGMYIECSNCFLMKVDPQTDTISIAVEWTADGASSLTNALSACKKEDIPFFTSRSFTVSSDSLMPEAFSTFFEEKGFTAGVFLPLFEGEENTMYLGFAHTLQSKKWAVEQVSFLNDAKRILQNILQKRRTQTSLNRSYAVMENALSHAGCGICVCAKEGRQILYANKEFEKLFEKPFDKKAFDEFIKNLDDETETVPLFHIERANLYVTISIAKMEWVDNESAYLLSIHDITELKKYEAAVEARVNIDETTDLPNRHQFNKDLVKALTGMIQSNTSGAVLYMNLDDFKDINDALGHKTGDVLLKLVSNMLKKVVANRGTCYRVGGDEFMILLPNVKDGLVEQISKKIKARFEHPWQLSYSDYYCTMCMGIAQFPQDGTQADSIIQRADIALRVAKKHGRNMIEFFNNKEEEGAIRRLDLEKALREAVFNGCEDFEVVYQPIVDFKREGHPCCGAEALVRWNTERFGQVMPNDFISLAEYLGLIIPIGEYVLKEAATRCKYWNDFGHPDYQVNVNVSMIQMMQSDFYHTVKQVLFDTGLNPAHLTLEVTESVAGYDIEHLKEVLAKIRELGVKLALDDFGTGYSSLNRLKDMPMDVLKIDKSFVDDIGKDIFSDAFIQTVTDLAGTIEVDVVVEGVEEHNQVEELKKIKADMIQGYYYDRPLSLEHFEKKYIDG